MDLGFLGVRGGEEGIELIPTVKLLCILLTKGERPLKKILLDIFQRLACPGLDASVTDQ